MVDDEFPNGGSREQDEAADDAELNPEAGVSGTPETPPDRDLPELGEPEADPGSERPRTPQAGL